MSAKVHTGSTLHVQGAARFAARLLALAFIAFAVATFLLSNLSIASIRYDLAITSFAPALADVRLSPVAYALSLPALQAAAVLFSLGVSLIIVARRSDDLVALIMAVTLVTFASVNLHHNDTIAVISPSLWIAQAINLLIALSAETLLIYLFPDGRPYPRPLLWVLIAAPLLHFFSASSILHSDSTSPGALLVYMAEILLFGVGLLAQVMRFRRILDPDQRQQVKWILAGFAFAGSAFVLYLLTVVIVFPRIGEWSVQRLLLDMTVDDGFHFLSLIVLALVIVNAILQRRLWDIDFAVNQALGIAGALLVLCLVFALVTGLVSHIAPLDVSLLAAALVSAALFIPARATLQRLIDTRLYGLRQPIAAFETAHDVKPTVSQPGAYTGRTLDGIELLDFMARGGMGEVYKGYASGTVYAVKVMPSDHHAEHIRRFQQEAEALRRIQHPNIVRLQRFGCADGMYYLAMDYLEGVSLRTHLIQNGALSLEDTETIVGDLASALDHIHAVGIVHRDLKPGNIMVKFDSSGRVTGAVLLDFGIARIVEMSITQTGMGSVGTIEYIAPEQILSSHTVTAAADIYALGVMTYEMLTGQRPFKGSQGQVLFAHIKQPAPDPRVLVPDLPMDASFAVRRAMSKEPEDRFASAQDFVHALSDLAGATTSLIQLH